MLHIINEEYTIHSSMSDRSSFDLSFWMDSGAIRMRIEGLSYFTQMKCIRGRNIGIMSDTHSIVALENGRGKETIYLF